MKILKEQENGNVTQRFCLAILQKCSIKDKKSMWKGIVFQGEKMTPLEPKPRWKRETYS